MPFSIAQGVVNYYTHRSTESEQMAVDGEVPGKEWVRDLNRMGTDSLELIALWCHEHDREIFWSMRMNDQHDRYIPHLMTRWKKEHPEYLMGEKDQRFPYGFNSWSALNYEMPEVREKVFSILTDVCSRYEVDGIEMDFFRHPILFKPQMAGLPVSEQQTCEMTELMRRIRTMTEQVGTRRKRPLLIALRIPDSVVFCAAMGIDLVTWLQEDLIDIVTGCGYFKLEPWENLAALGRRYDIPTYACFVSRRLLGGGEPEVPTSIPVWRGEALNAWKAGINGIYLFNRFDPKDPVLRELGNPKLLETLDRVDQTAYAHHNGYLNPEGWLKGGRTFVKEP